MSRYAGAALIIMYACTEQHHDSAALHHRAMEVESKKMVGSGCECSIQTGELVRFCVDLTFNVDGLKKGW
ncbi:hypothetical protein ACN6AX_25070 [Paenibacillus polymyxa]|uniref:hypothetical protein n=1 Tax=Paenibacillus polymyxa TaxID=1406 RepID=UPI00211D3FFA|nr:hypothetical protein [Paenibacillus polymyxa]